MSTMPKIWEDSVVRDYLTPEAHQKSREQFLKTHIDIDKIRADYLFPHEGSDEFVTQEEFRDAILKSRVDDDNRIFILRGETGSGKSQLCQWLEYQIGANPDEGDETHIALHVSRSKTGIGDILDIISGPIDTDVSVNNVSDLDPEKVADAIITTLQAFGGGWSSSPRTRSRPSPRTDRTRPTFGQSSREISPSIRSPRRARGKADVRSHHEE
ncbi:hypothetical protein VB773_19945 [Haloarculaceae archaeon H-GB2-1]|nr:hypothetical protein [Haloarculaceae archaeon H-GB2-1]